jgi:hypothetical protein
MADPGWCERERRYGMRFRKATTTSPTTAKAVAAIMVCAPFT